MDKLTKKEQAWVDEVNAVLARCPSKRLGFYTIGDDQVMLYDAKKHRKGCEAENADLVAYLNRNGGAIEDCLYFTAPVEGVCR